MSDKKVKKVKKVTLLHNVLPISHSRTPSKPAETFQSPGEHEKRHAKRQTKLVTPSTSYADSARKGLPANQHQPRDRSPSSKKSSSGTTGENKSSKSRRESSPVRLNGLTNTQQRRLSPKLKKVDDTRRIDKVLGKVEDLRKQEETRAKHSSSTTQTSPSSGSSVKVTTSQEHSHRATVGSSSQTSPPKRKSSIASTSRKPMTREPSWPSDLESRATFLARSETIPRADDEEWKKMHNLGRSFEAIAPPKWESVKDLVPYSEEVSRGDMRKVKVAQARGHGPSPIAPPRRRGLL